MKKHIKIILSIIVALIIITCTTISKAKTISEQELENIVNQHNSIDTENITVNDIVAIYDDVTSKYTNDDIADTIEHYSQELQENGLDEDNISTLTFILHNTDTKALRDLLKETDLDELQSKIEKITETGEISDLFTDNSLNFMIKLLLTNKIVKNTTRISLLLGIYVIVVRWIIYKKAGKHGWAALVPIYKDVVWLKVSGLSPWLLLFFLLPVIGWIILGIVFIISKFTLPTKFGKSGAWGIGIWLCPVIFESIVAFSSKFQYIGNDEE